MELYNLEENVNVLSVHVKSFPQGVGEVFDALAKMLPDGLERPYYGISYMDSEDRIIYKAAAAEKYDGEAEKYNCEPHVIEKGQYLAITIFDWHQKVESIKDIFHEMMQDVRVDQTKPCIEWYKSDDEMMCMMKMESGKDS